MITMFYFGIYGGMGWLTAGVLVYCSHRTTAADRDLPDLKVGCQHAYGRVREPAVITVPFSNKDRNELCLCFGREHRVMCRCVLGFGEGDGPAGGGRPSSGLGQQMAGRCPRRAAPKIAGSAAAAWRVYSGGPAGRPAGGEPVPPGSLRRRGASRAAAAAGLPDGFPYNMLVDACSDWPACSLRDWEVLGRVSQFWRDGAVSFGW